MASRRRAEKWAEAPQLKRGRRSRALGRGQPAAKSVRTPARARNPPGCRTRRPGTLQGSSRNPVARKTLTPPRREDAGRRGPLIGRPTPELVGEVLECAATSVIDRESNA